MSRTASQCRINRSGRLASWAAKPWRRSSLFSPVSAFSRLPKRRIPTNAQSWDYDAVGNWDSVTTNSTTQTRGANRQNEITSVSGATTPTYDNNGNLTKDENDNRFVWDAWNQEVKIKNSTNTVIATNAYDGLNHKVQVTTGAGLIDKIFGKNDWQVFEEKNGSNTLNRYVWSPVYVDALVTRDRDTDANGTLDERLFALQDANWNVTGITNRSGTIQERFTEGPFGVPTIRDGSGSTISVSTKGWDILHQGAKADIIGDYDFRNRVLSPTLGRWLSNDPIGFSAGDVNTFRYVGNGPGNRLDPMGLLEGEKEPYEDIINNPPWMYRPGNDDGNPIDSNKPGILKPGVPNGNGNPFAPNNPGILPPPNPNSNPPMEGFPGILPVPGPNIDGNNLKWGIDWGIRTPIPGTGHPNTIPFETPEQYIAYLNEMIRRGLGIGGRMSSGQAPTWGFEPNPNGFGHLRGDVQWNQGDWQIGGNASIDDKNAMIGGTYIRNNDNGISIGGTGSAVMPLEPNHNGQINGGVFVTFPIPGGIPSWFSIGGNGGYDYPNGGLLKPGHWHYDFRFEFIFRY